MNTKRIIRTWSAIRSLCGVALILAASLLLSSCREEEEQALTLLIWTDYINPDLLAAFEAQENCSVKVETYDDNEELKEIVVRRSIDADIIVPSSFELGNLKPDIDKISLSQLPHSGYIDSEYWRSFDHHEYGVPYFIAPTGIAVRPDDIPAKVLKEGGAARIPWSILDGPNAEGEALASYASMLGDKRETIAAALIASGYEANSSDDIALKKAGETIQRWIRKGMRMSNETYLYDLLAGRRQFSHVYMGDALPLEPDVRFALPTEGFVMTCDFLCIPKSSKKKKLAHRFIDFLCKPSNSAKNMAWTLYYAPNPEGFAHLKKSEPRDFPFQHFAFDLWKREGEYLKPLAKEDEEKYDRLWAELSPYIEQ